MAVRVRLRLRDPGGREVVCSAVLNGGFEVPEPHLLLPHRCAERILGDYRPSAVVQAMEAAGGEVNFFLASSPVTGAVKTEDHEGREVSFRVLISDADHEVLVSDSGIDALGIRIETFSPGHWRFVDQTLIRDSEPPQYW